MNNPTIKTVRELMDILGKDQTFPDKYELRIYGNTDDKGGGQIQIVDTKENKIVEIINI